MKKNTPSSRATEFCDTGAKLAAKIGVVNVTRRAIAEAHNVTDPLVGKHIPGGKAALQKGIRKSMKALGLVEPTKDVIAAKGKELRARPKAVKKSPSKAVKKSVAKKSAKVTTATKPATPTAKTKGVKKVNDKPKDKPKAPSNKDKVAAPANKAFPTKTPPLPTL